MQRGVLVVALAWMSVTTATACGGADSEESADASPPLSVGEVCDVLADAFCARNEECSLGVPPPCDENFAATCCEEAGGCQQSTGATAERAEACADGMGAVSCTDLESGALPSPCAGILMPLVTSGALIPVRATGIEGARTDSDPTTLPDRLQRR